MKRALLVLLLAPASADAREWPEANPGRPSFSTNATTTAKGALELETGVAIDPDATAIVNALKYGLFERFDVRLLHAQAIDPEVDVALLGVQLKYCLRPDEDGKPGFGVAPYYLAPVVDGDPHDFGAAAIVTWPIGPIAIDANVNVDVKAGGAGDETILELDPVATLSFPIFGELGGYVESYALIPLNGPDTDVGVVAATGVGYALSKSLVLDASVDFGVTDAVPDYLIQVGLTASIYALQP